MTINNQLITDKWVIAEYFNNYCVNIGSSLDEKFSPNGIDPSMYIKDRNLHTIFISPVGEDGVETIIISLTISSPGWDLKTPCIGKLTYHAFILPLTHIINLS